VRGFRAPTLSLKSSTAWMYELLAEAGFTYSSSVLPSSNPLYGWPGFGASPRRMAGIWEIPVSLLPWGPVRVPFASGIYLRVLPRAVVRAAAELRRRDGEPVVGYLHPYDLDAEQERFRHPFTEDNLLYHWAMYWGRRGALGKVQSILAAGYRIDRYLDFVAQLPAPARAA
jgi:hypothetical protein